MNVNIYDEASLMQISFQHDKHTQSSLNKQKYIKKKYYSESDLISQPGTKTVRVRPNSNLYQSGINFLKHKQEKQEYLHLKLEEEFKKKYTFKPEISLSSRIVSARANNMNSFIKNKGPDTQTQKLEQELIECTFSPKILKSVGDIFDRRKPMYERNIQWQESVKERQAQSQVKKESMSKLKLTPKQMDLRAEHALKKNFSMKYLRKSMIVI